MYNLNTTMPRKIIKTELRKCTTALDEVGVGVGVGVTVGDG